LVHEPGHEVVNDDDSDDGVTNGSAGRSADAERASLCLEPLVAGDGRDHDSKDEGLQENASLRKLNLSGCGIGPDTAFVLEDVLQTIAGQIADCVFELPSGEEVDPNLVNVVIETPEGPVEIYKDPSHQDGWDYTDGSQTHIQLHGPACELYKQQKGNTISIVLGCESVLK